MCLRPDGNQREGDMALREPKLLVAIPLVRAVYNPGNVYKEPPLSSTDVSPS